MGGTVAEKTADTASRVAYYRAGSRMFMHIVTIQAVIILALTAALTFYLGTRVNRDRYAALMADDSNRQMQMVALPSPNMGRNAIANWAASATSQILTFGFNDIDERFKLSRQNFTKDGWKNFQQAMINTKLIELMTSTQQIMTTVPLSVPELKREGMMNGRYSWVFDIKVLVTFRAGSSKSTRPKNVRVVIEKVPTRENPVGVGISEWYIY